MIQFLARHMSEGINESLSDKIKRLTANSVATTSAEKFTAASVDQKCPDHPDHKNIINLYVEGPPFRIYPSFTDICCNNFLKSLRVDPIRIG